MAFMDKVKYFLGFGDDDEYDEEYYDDDEEEMVEDEPKKETSIWIRRCSEIQKKRIFHHQER